ncbi:MAG: phage tail sheath subtilisin-like domain-containing protein [Nitrospira sp.]|nr:phage tail sheath subtilisin-like domain-containing protein [Nitrospira sp.]
MPEYLSPGVFIEEISSALKAIEGVSTSTAAFVGRARRGTVPGYAWPGSSAPNLPFTPTDGFVLTPDPAPVLVTSFAEFQRTFGPPLPIPLENDPTDYGFLGWAVRAFFDNGGKRAYIARIVDASDTPSTLRVAQGIAYRLLRSASKNDKTIFLTSTRGLQAGNDITFVRHSNGQNALGRPAAAAIAIGIAGPFGLKDGDKLDVTTNTPVATVTVTVVAKPAKVQTSGATPFSIPDGATLQVRIGPASEPIQTVVFSLSDPVVPITPGAATVAQVEAVLQRYVNGVKVSQSGGQVVMETDIQGTAARVEIVAGSAVAPLGLSTGVTGPPSGSTVPDSTHVTVADFASLFSSPNFSVGADGAGRLQFITTAPGAGVTIKLDEVPPGNGLLQRLGFGAVSTLTQNGTAAIPSTLTITSYDAQSNSISFGTAIGEALESSDIYGIVTAASIKPDANKGPQFFARTPGSWSESLRVQIANSDRQAVPILGTAVIALGATKLKVQNVSSLYVGAAVEIDYSGTARSNHQITDIDSGTRQLTISPPTTNAINPSGTPTPTVRTLEIDVIVSDTSGAAPTEIYRGLSWNQSAVADVRRHYASAINSSSRLVWVQPPGVGLPSPLSGSENFTLDTQPTTLDGFPMSPTTIGSETFVDLDDTWVGTDNGPGARSGIESLKEISEARIIASPGKTSATIQLALISQCELLRYRFAILDGERDPAGGSITSILTHRNLYDTSFAAYYQPWVTVKVDGQTRYLPSSGYLAGIYARVDNDRGVWKAPANEPVLNVIGLKTHFTTGEQDLLNPRGVNLTRQFDIGGIRVWGARTLSSDPDVKYINVRRMLIFLEASIDRGTQWVVFEPNAPETWVRLTDSVSAFLLTQWRAGALFGRKPEQAFFVRCDESTMTADDILNGRLICHIGVAIVRPAEFIIFRIEQITNFGAAQ